MFSPECSHLHRALVQADVIDSAAGVTGKIRAIHVIYDSDDGVPSLARHRLNSVERIFVGPIPARQLLVDYGNRLRARAI